MDCFQVRFYLNSAKSAFRFCIFLLSDVKNMEKARGLEREIKE